MISVLALLLVLGQLYWPSASPQANTATHELITRPIRKSSRNYIIIFENINLEKSTNSQGLESWYLTPFSTIF